MSDATTIARPYAKAIFKHALTAKQLALWSTILHDLANIVLHSETAEFIGNPASTYQLQADLVLHVSATTTACVSTEAEVMTHFVQLLACNHRLLVLPDIYLQYEALRAEQEKTVTASVSSFAELSAAQQQSLIQQLSERLQRQVTLEVSIDTSLLGGAVIRAGDLVIDGSVRGKLHKLGTSLAA